MAHFSKYHQVKCMYWQIRFKQMVVLKYDKQLGMKELVEKKMYYRNILINLLLILILILILINFNLLFIIFIYGRPFRAKIVLNINTLFKYSPAEAHYFVSSIPESQLKLLYAGTDPVSFLISCPSHGVILTKTKSKISLL